MARILMLTGRYPYPLDDGWKIRSSSLLEGLGAAGNEVDLLTFSANGDAADRADAGGRMHELLAIPRTKAYAPSDLLRGLVTGTPFSVWNYRQADFARAFGRIASGGRHDVVLVEDIVMAQYALDCDIPVKILDMHNVESDLLRRFADNSPSLARKAYARITADKLARYETRAANRFDAVLTCSGDDRDRLRAMGVQTPVRVTPNGVRTSFYDEVAASEPEEDAIVFVGSMDYHANISGVAHFVRSVLPRILERRPSLVFYVVGKNPPEDIRALASANVVVTGGVEDVRPYLRRAKAVVVPLLVGGGTRLKILEAMASGRPVVSTRLGAEGIEVRNGEHILLADEPGDIAAATLALLDDPQRRGSIGRAARQYVAATYDWSIVTSGLNEAVATMLAEKETRTA